MTHEIIPTTGEVCLPCTGNCAQGRHCPNLNPIRFDWWALAGILVLTFSAIVVALSLIAVFDL